jgi:hypothetical protein
MSNVDDPSAINDAEDAQYLAFRNSDNFLCAVALVERSGSRQQQGGAGAIGTTAHLRDHELAR